MSTADRMDQIKGAVHTAVRHDSAENHVTGRSVFIDDMPNVPGTLHGALVKSPYAHARIQSIDVSAARDLPGVHAVLVAADIPGRNDVAPIFEGEPILAEGLVEYIGHPVAAIAAETMDIARAAEALVVIDYVELEPVLSIDDALNRKSFTSPPQIMRRGNSIQGMADAPHQISGEVRCGGQDRHAGLFLDPASNRSSAWCGNGTWRAS